MTIAKSKHYELINNDGKYEIYKDGNLIFFSIDDTDACKKFKDCLIKDDDFDTPVEINLRYWTE